MKKIMKKLGVFGIIIAMIIPFLELPVVKAEDDDNCSIHTQTYLFLDVDSMGAYKDGGYTTYANFANTFKNVDSEVEILDIYESYVETPEQKKAFDRFYAAIRANDTYTLKSGNTYSAGVFVEDDSNEYADNTIIQHYEWARYYENGTEITDWSNYVGGYNSVQWGLSQANKKLPTNDGASDSVKIVPASYDNRSQSFKDNNTYKNLEDYFKSVANSDDDYLQLKITRKYDFAGVRFGFEAADGKHYIYKDGYAGTPWIVASGELEETTDTKYFPVYEAKSHSVVSNKVSGEQKDTISYFWPHVLVVEYQTCSNDTVNPESKWKLKYNANVTDNSVKNMPDESAETDMKSDIAIDDKTPVRDGYTFKGWCIDEKECSNPLKAKENVESPESGTVRVAYAQWGKTGTEENKKTGVVSYIIGFLSVGAIAAGIYFIAKKKNLFKQI